MVWKKHDYDNLPGTVVFDGECTHTSYNLNKMAFSFNSPENRAEFADDMDAYCRKFELTDDQRVAVLDGDFPALLRLGGNIYYLAKIAVFHGMTMQDAGAAFQNITTEQFKQKLADNAAGFQQHLEKRGGYWNG